MVKYEFSKTIRMAEVEDTLAIAVAAGESLHGAAAVRLSAGVELDRKRRTCSIDTSSSAGESIARVFTGLVQQCFGADSFRVARAA